MPAPAPAPATESAGIKGVKHPTQWCSVFKLNYLSCFCGTPLSKLGWWWKPYQWSPTGGTSCVPNFCIYTQKKWAGGNNVFGGSQKPPVTFQVTWQILVAPRILEPAIWAITGLYTFLTKYHFMISGFSFYLEPVINIHMLWHFKIILWGAHVPYHTCGSQRTPVVSKSSPPIICLPGLTFAC